MPTAETVPVEPIVSPNNPPRPKRKQTLLAFLFLIFVLSSFCLIYLLKNTGFNLNRFFPKSNVVKPEKIKVQISPQELSAAIELEKAYQQASPATASASIESLARQRVTEDKILEIEGRKLGINPDQIRKDSLPVLVTREGVSLTATPSSSLYGYEQKLHQSLKEKVEGYVEKQVLSIVLSSPNSSASAQKVANEVLPLLQKGTFDSQTYLKDHPLDKSLSFYNRIIRDPLKAYPDLSKLSLSGQTKTETTPFSADLTKIDKIEKGLGMSFEAWYQNVRKKYF